MRLQCTWAMPVTTLLGRKLLRTRHNCIVRINYSLNWKHTLWFCKKSNKFLVFRHLSLSWARPSNVEPLIITNRMVVGRQDAFASINLSILGKQSSRNSSSPVDTEELWWAYPPQKKLQAPPNWNNVSEIFVKCECQPPPAQTQSPPIDDFLATVLNSIFADLSQSKITNLQFKSEHLTDHRRESGKQNNSGDVVQQRVHG